MDQQSNSELYVHVIESDKEINDVLRSSEKFINLKFQKNLHKYLKIFK